jgi:hypothetical protein
MAFPIFKSFISTILPWVPTAWRKEYRLLTDASTGAPIGIQSQNANGPDGIWGKTNLTAAQIAAPTAAMLQDLNATYRLNDAPYSQYHSDGTQLIPSDPTGGTVIPPGFIPVYASPLSVTEGHSLIIQGGVRVIA